MNCRAPDGPRYSAGFTLLLKNGLPVKLNPCGKAIADVVDSVDLFLIAIAIAIASHRGIGRIRTVENRFIDIKWLLDN